MTSKSDLMEKAKIIFEKRGKDALKKVQSEILESRYDGGAVSSALKYFAKVTLRNSLPVFPALVSLSCGAVGGEIEKTSGISAAMMLIAGTADIHDDIIDQSDTKYAKKTVKGKFGCDIALLAGDALLIQGFMLLQRECESLSKEQRTAILDLTCKAFFEISKAEAKETTMKKKFDISPEEYLEILRLKAVIPDIHCRIGGILGNADEPTVDSLGHYGRTFGMVSGIREEFIDLMDYDELKNRINNECIPLPMLFAFQNIKNRNEINPLIEGSHLSKKDAERIIDVVLGSNEVQELKGKMLTLINKEVSKLSFIKRKKEFSESKLLLEATAEGLLSESFLTSSPKIE